MKIGFAGLGVMGGPMARHLVQAGHEVAGFNRSPDKARAWSDRNGGRFAATVAEAAAGAGPASNSAQRAENVRRKAIGSPMLGGGACLASIGRPASAASAGLSVRRSP